MEDDKLANYYDTLKRSAPKGRDRKGGLGMGSSGTKKWDDYDGVDQDSMTKVRALKLNFERCFVRANKDDKHLEEEAHREHIIGKSDFSGSKVVFNEDSDSESGKEVEKKEKKSKKDKKEKKEKKEKKDKKKKESDSDSDSDVEPAKKKRKTEEPKANGKAEEKAEINWKKMIKKTLKDAEGEMRVKKLRKEIVKQCTALRSDLSKSDLKSQFDAQLAKASKHFTVEGKNVRLNQD